MAEVTIYTSMFCGFCHHAKRLLAKKGIAFEEIDVNSVPGAHQEMMARTQGRTVPQILINGRPIGGCDELYALNADDRLDGLLAEPAQAAE